MKIQSINQWFQTSGGAWIALAAMLSMASPASAEGDKLRGGGAPFTKIYAFGDSLSDTGNFFALSGSPGEPYFEGRFSNGPVWIEYLAQDLGMGGDDVINYAVGGATTGRENNLDIPGYTDFPGLQDQLDFFEDDLGDRPADRRALYIVWAGANDFFVSEDGPEETIASAIENTAVAVQRLYAAGARRIMVVNLPDLGLTPLSRLWNQSAELSFLSAIYNHSLEQMLDQLAFAGIVTSRLDAERLMQDIVALPVSFGLSNVTDSFIDVGGDPSGFLFWDRLHPSTAGHVSIAEEAMAVLRSDFRHAWATPRNSRVRQASH